MKQLTFKLREFNKEFSYYFVLANIIEYLLNTFLETSHISGSTSATNPNERSIISTPKTCCIFSLLVLSSFVVVLLATKHESNDYKIFIFLALLLLIVMFLMNI